MELYCHFEGLYACAMTDISFRTDEAESRTVELESMIRECEDDGHQIDLLRDYCEENSLWVDSQWRLCRERNTKHSNSNQL